MLKVSYKDLVLPFRIDHDFLAQMALLGRFHHIDIKVTFTLKTTLRVLELFPGLLGGLFRVSRKTQTMPDPPNSVSDASQPP